MGGDTPRRLPQKLYVLKYEHKHGDDLSIYTSAEGAEIAAVHLMLEYMWEFGDASDNMVGVVLDLIKMGKYPEAIMGWPAISGHTEAFDILECTVYPDPPRPCEALIKEAEEQLASNESEGGSQVNSGPGTAPTDLASPTGSGGGIRG